jgi:hypothetical protein
MKKFTRYNFFKYTYCEFTEVSEDIFKNNKTHYKSKSDSQYYYTLEGVYRYSDHWGRVANCRWKLLSNCDFKNQVSHLGYAKWSDFFEINNTEKLFYIKVDYNFKKVNFHHKEMNSSSSNFLFTAQEAQKRQKQIRTLFNETSWAKYYNKEIEHLRFGIINSLINSNKSLQEIKLMYKE